MKSLGDGEYTVKALTPIEDFNEQFGTAFSDEEFDTIGGLVVKAFGTYRSGAKRKPSTAYASQWFAPIIDVYICYVYWCRGMPGPSRIRNDTQTWVAKLR